MLQVTDNARDHLVEVRRERRIHDEAAARLTGINGRVGLSFAMAPAKDDKVVQMDGIDVYVAAEIADRLAGAVIDAGTYDGEEVLVLRHQPAPGEAI